MDAEEVAIGIKDAGDFDATAHILDGFGMTAPRLTRRAILVGIRHAPIGLHTVDTWLSSESVQFENRPREAHIERLINVRLYSQIPCCTRLCPG